MDSYVGGSVIMWAVISNYSKRELVYVPGNLTAVRYRDEIIHPHLMHVIDRQRELFQQDKARSLTARLTMDYQNSRITSMCYHGLPNRRIWIQLSTVGTICASVNIHLKHSINSDKCCNRNGEQYYEIMLENWFSLCRGNVEQCDVLKILNSLISM